MYSMSPAWALVRNAAMIVAALLVMYALPQFKTYTATKILGVLSVAAAVALPIIYSEKAKQPSPIRLSSIYTHGAPKLAADVTKGRHLIAYFSLTCPHCKTAAKTLADIRRQDPSLPIVMVLGGRKKRLDEFFSESGSRAVPYTHVQPWDSFVSMAGPAVPAIYFVEDSRVVRALRPSTITRSSIANWTRP
jgi:glutaredoxin